MLSLLVVLLAPESRGYLELASDDPRTPPRIYQNFLSAEADKETIRDGLRTARRIFKEKPLSEMVGDEITPGLSTQTDTALDDYVRNAAVTVSHPLGTCRMGIDNSAVTDPQLRFNGIDGLRVVDASVMPDLVGGNINATVIAIAEKAADLIKSG